MGCPSFVICNEVHGCSTQYNSSLHKTMNHQLKRHRQRIIRNLLVLIKIQVDSLISSRRSQISINQRLIMLLMVRLGGMIQLRRLGEYGNAWWRAKRWDASLHHFTWAARLVVLVQLSSASCERVFSQVKLIVETCGVSPLEETLETRLMERCNVYSIIN